MALDLEKRIEAAFGGVQLPMPDDWPPIKVIQGRVEPLWKNFGNKGSVLVEEAFFLYSLVRMTKPRFVLDCGTWMGMSAAWMAEALRDNGFGRIVTVEHHDAAVTAASMFFEQAGYKEIELVHKKIEDYLPPEPIDFLMLDTEVADRSKQFAELKRFFDDKCWVVFHDAGAVKGLCDLPYPYIHFGTIREMRIYCVKKTQKTGIYAPLRPKAGE